MSLQRSSSQIPWIEKYRPDTFDNLIGNNRLLRVFHEYIYAKSLPNIFIYGPSGTGKTTLALLLGRSLYGNLANSMMLHLNASDEKNVEMFRRKIFQFATSQNLFLDRNKKLIFIDEVDMLSTEMQTVVCDGLSQLSEHLYFVLCGNNRYSLQVRLLSRVVCIMFPPLSISETTQGLRRILREEGMDTEDTESACHHLYVVLGGDLRKMVNSLQAILLRCGTFSVSSINKILLNNAELDADAFVRLLKTCSVRESVAFLTDEILENSQDFIEWVRYIFNYLFQNFVEQGKEEEKEFLQYTQFMADIEHNASFVVDNEIQIYSFVAITHRFVNLMSS